MTYPALRPTRNHPGHNRSRVEIDLTGIDPNTLLTLSFDLLGFGAADSTIRIDNIGFGDLNSAPAVS